MAKSPLLKGTRLESKIASLMYLSWLRTRNYNYARKYAVTVLAKAPDFWQARLYYARLLDYEVIVISNPHHIPDQSVKGE